LNKKERKNIPTDFNGIVKIVETSFMKNISNWKTSSSNYLKFLQDSMEMNRYTIAKNAVTN
jgi:hypothetical protein